METLYFGCFLFGAAFTAVTFVLGHEATLAQGKAEAETLRLKGEAQAGVVRATGQAEADAMHQRADAYQQYNQAAVLDKMLTNMPEMARAFAEALRSVDRIAIVSSGDGRTGGASALTGEVARMVSQMPEVLETLTGKKVGELLAQLQGVQQSPIEPKANGKTADAEVPTA